MKNLRSDAPSHNYSAMDISDLLMRRLDESIKRKLGMLTDIPFEDNSFDVVYTCEVLEHAVDICSAVRELARVTRPGGKIIIIDKLQSKLGTMEIGEWEQWFDAEELKSVLEEYCSEVIVEQDIDYENNPIPGLFAAWVGTMK